MIDRFHYLNQEDAKDLHDYVYHICAQPGSGEYALATLLLPGAFARKPLFDRLARLSMPTTFICILDYFIHEMEMWIGWTIELLLELLKI